jgi:hypothetical protein
LATLGRVAHLQGSGQLDGLLRSLTDLLHLDFTSFCF